MKTSPTSRLRAAFTLVELLTVIGIIGVLIGILIPVLSAVKRASNTSTCLNNLRQAGVAFHLYLSDNKGVFPRQASGSVSPSNGATWWENVAPYADWKTLQAGSNVALNTFMHCPNHTEYPGSFSYFANNYIVKKPEQAPVLLVNVVSPARKILLYEVHTNCSWPQVGNAGAGIGKSPFFPAYANPTHGSASNHLFVDGHVASSSENLSQTIKWWDPSGL